MLVVEFTKRRPRPLRRPLSWERPPGSAWLPGLERVGGIYVPVALFDEIRRQRGEVESYEFWQAPNGVVCREVRRWADGIVSISWAHPL